MGTPSTLAEHIAQHGALEPSNALAIAMACAKQLAELHARGLVHGSLSPATVWIEGDAVSIADPSPPPAASARTGPLPAAALYLAPEQLQGTPDARTDVWALGMTLYAMLAGRPPFFDLKTFAEMSIAMRTQRIAPVQSRAPWVPPTLARALHAMLLPVERRIASMDAAIAALGRTESGELRAVPVSDATRKKTMTVAITPRAASDLIGPSGELTKRAEIDLVGRTINDRYLIDARIGAGGMADVYEATDLMPERAAYGEVAIKVLHDDAMGDAEGRSRFLREAKAAGRIPSTYVAKVLDSGVDSVTDLPYLVMERLRGRDLASVLRSYGALSPGPILTLFLHAAEALEAAHSIGIVHRDIKPSNLFVHELASGTVVLKVCDFGIAKVLAQGSQSLVLPGFITGPGNMLGSPLYMSPEQAMSSTDVDGRTDVFSLALSLHEALSGKMPWEGRASAGEIIAAVCTEDVPSLRHVAPWLDPGLADAVARALARDMTKRTPSVAELARELRPFALARSVEPDEIYSPRIAR